MRIEAAYLESWTEPASGRLNITIAIRIPPDHLPLPPETPPHIERFTKPDLNSFWVCNLMISNRPYYYIHNTSTTTCLGAREREKSSMQQKKG